MKNDFDPNLPIYIQVMEEIKKEICPVRKDFVTNSILIKEIFASEYLPGSKLASVRELALEYGVNPNTIQKALSELERTGIIYSRRALGRFVSEDSNLISELKKDVSLDKVKVFIEEMRKLGFSKIEVIKMIEELD